MQGLSEVRDFLTRHSIENSSILVALSGGTDSIALLHFLLELKEEFNLELSIAHLDHGLRGKASEKDARFVRSKAREMGLSATINKREVSRVVDEENLSLEEAAREVRYEFLSEIADEQGVDYVALGHNRNDQAETVLMNIIRGAGLRGLGGMQEVKGRYIRPLLKLKRDEIKNYIETRGLDYRRDKTNKNTDFLRNRIRHELVPELEDHYNPKVVENLTRMAELAEEAHSFIEDRADDVSRDIRIMKKVDETCFDRAKLSALNTYLQKAVIRKLISKVKGDLQDVTSTHVDNVLSKIGDEPARTRLSLPGVTFTLNRNTACFVREFNPGGQEEFRYEIQPGETLELEEVSISINLELVSKSEELNPEKYLSDSLTEFVDWGKVEQPIIVRNRNEGDRFKPLGMRGEKKLKDFFIDEKVPFEERDKVPIVCDKEGIIWVVGHRIDERYKLEESTERGLLIKARKI
ncbi:tRNA lysidine(34) synthetase TilS [Candidatus Bipolaricaulota bacterium]|nr:tRNA lysidine(34) synthetase TilS [Candidatus Bipolaricaulota bacterium]